MPVYPPDGWKTDIPRYYDPLRLPSAHLDSFACRYLLDTLHTRLLFVSPDHRQGSYHRIRVYPVDAGDFAHWPVSLNLLAYQETDGSLEFPNYPFESMPRSQTPVVS